MRVVNNILAFYGHWDIPSNHHRCKNPFKVKEYTFKTMEGYIMFSKAMLFGDHETAELILNEPHPQEQKILGRRVKPYDDDYWVHRRPGIYLAGLFHRYEQNPEDKAWLISTAPYTLAEASDRDLFWGTGFKETDQRIGQPDLWKGQNLCGRQQQVLRNYYLKNDQSPSEKVRIIR